MARYTEKKKANRKKIKFSTILCFLLVLIMIFSGYKVVTILLHYRESEKTYSDIASRAVASGTVLKPAQTIPEKEEILLPEKTEGISVDFDSLFNENPNITAWLYSENTVINYPVVQGNDNDYYLDHQFDYTYGISGTLFVDYRNQSDFAGKQTIIYGHNMDNGSMFGSLLKYENQIYYDKHPVMYLYTPKKNYIVMLFSGFVASTDNWCYQQEYSDAEYPQYLEYLKASSCFENDVTVTSEDKIVALSTCAYDFENARFVLFGKLIEAAEE